MRRFRFVALLLSLALLTGLVLSVSGGPPVEAHDEEADDEIESRFDLVDNPLFTPGGGAGEGKFELDGEDLDKLKFKLKMEAHGLTPNTWYYLAVTVREGFGGVQTPVAIAVAGMARTDSDGKLEFKGKGVLPNVFDGPGPWRIDQQIRKLGSGTRNFCVECILVCSPTTKVELNDDGDGLVSAS